MEGEKDWKNKVDKKLRTKIKNSIETETGTKKEEPRKLQIIVLLKNDSQVKKVKPKLREINFKHKNTISELGMIAGWVSPKNIKQIAMLSRVEKIEYDEKGDRIGDK